MFYHFTMLCCIVCFAVTIEPMMDVDGISPEVGGLEICILPLYHIMLCAVQSPSNP